MLICYVQFEKFTHQMQDGWGLATDGKVLFGSDGTSALYLIDPQTYKGFSCIPQLVSILPPPNAPYECDVFVCFCNLFICLFMADITHPESN